MAEIEQGPDSINFTGYKVLIPNTSWRKFEGIMAFPGMDVKVPSERVIQMMRYVVPPIDQIIESIREQARTYVPGKKIDEASAARFFPTLPLEEIAGIAKGRKESIDLLTKNYPDARGEVGRTYLNVATGILHEEMLDKAAKLVHKEGPGIIALLLNKFGTQDWNLTLRLNAENTLPDRQEIDYLTTRGVRDSDVFFADGDFGNYTSIPSQLNFIYETLNNPQILGKIYDHSTEYSVVQSILTVQKTANSLNQEKLVHSLVGMLFGPNSPLGKAGSSADMPQEQHIASPKSGAVFFDHRQNLKVPMHLPKKKNPGKK